MRRLVHHAYLVARQGRVLALLKRLERDEWLPATEIAAAQRARLRAVLVHASKHVPFYRDFFAGAGLNPGLADPAEALARLPIVTKQMLRERGDAFLSDDAMSRGATVNATGGSTGVPLTFFQDDLYRLYRQAVMYRGFRWCGWRIGGPLAYLWGSDVDSRSHRGAGAVRDAALGVTWIDAFTLDDTAIDAVLARLKAARPQILIGYASSVRHLARRSLERGGGPPLRAIETSAELLTADARAEIEKAFETRVLDRYGCREAGVIAHECGAGDGWHINTETVWLETDADGRLLVSTLMNYSMPLLRYRNEDLVELGRSQCRCGRGLPMMTKVIGRRSDIVLSPSGRAIHGEFFTHLFYGVPGVIEFQVVQKTLEDLVIRVVSGPAFGVESRERIEQTIRAHGDPRFKIRWEMVREIPHGLSGKHRFTLSELTDPPVGTAEVKA